MSQPRHLATIPGKFRHCPLACLAAILLAGCAGDYQRLAEPAEASSCAAWLTDSAPLASAPRVDLLDEPVTVAGQPVLGVAYPALNLVRVTRGAPDQTAARLVHEMAHIYGADEVGADFAERNAWRCSLG